jgi:EAL domain-containing protein (putative c-di-GMP-specific phosphodiesterase class I)
VFTGDMKRNPAHSKIVRALVGLARDLGLRVVASGVEDAETALSLSTLGCDRIQGGHVSPPMAAQEIVDFAARLAEVSPRPGTG